MVSVSIEWTKSNQGASTVVGLDTVIGVSLKGINCLRQRNQKPETIWTK